MKILRYMVESRDRVGSRLGRSFSIFQSRRLEVKSRPRMHELKPLFSSPDEPRFVGYSLHRIHSFGFSYHLRSSGRYFKSSGNADPQSCGFVGDFSGLLSPVALVTRQQSTRWNGHNQRLLKSSLSDRQSLSRWVRSSSTTR